MKFNLTAGWEDGTADLTQHLLTELSSGKKVFWLLSGGSNTAVSVEVMDKISVNLSQYLTISLIDERYGETADYPESNWTKLMAAGFQAKKSAIRPILEDGLGFEEAIEKYQKIIAQGFESCDITLAQIGIGDDGHVAGILPNSPATIETKELVCGYQSHPFLRLTTTFTALKEVDVAYVFAFGDNKKEALHTLQTQNISTAKQPAQVLKDIPIVRIYSDQVGDNS